MNMQILHVDMDAFYAAVEERDNPELARQALAVGGDPSGRGVVSTANYIARRFGVQSAMPAATARRLCPELVFVRPRMHRYAATSEQIREIFHRYTPLVETLSLDEAFLDVRGSEKLHGDSIRIGEKIRDAIAEETGLTASVGVSINKFLAKLASDLDKPNGFVQIPHDRIHATLDPLPVGRLWGVGKSTKRRLEALGAYTIKDVRVMPVDILNEHFGTLGKRLGELANGVDSRRVVPTRKAKSISHETTFAEDIRDHDAVKSVLMALAEDVGHRLRANQLSGQTVQVKIRHRDFKTVVRSQTLPSPTDHTQKIFDMASGLAMQYLGNGKIEIRLLGVGVSGLVGGHDPAEAQGELFTRHETDPVDSLVDDVARKFGRGAVTRARALTTPMRNRSKDSS